MELNGKIMIDELAFVVFDESGMNGEFKQERTIENLSRQENVQELIKGMTNFLYTRAEEGGEQATMADFLSEVSLFTDQDSDKDQDADRVTFMTVHAAKGLEFKNVFVVGLEEDLFPSTLSKDKPRAIEEERRLFYVAITRAEDNCILTYAKSRFRNGSSTLCSPSRFLHDLDTKFLEIKGGDVPAASGRFNKFADELPEIKLPHREIREERLPERKVVTENKPSVDGFAIMTDLSVGMTVEHNLFGKGVVAAVEGEGSKASAVIEFNNLGTKRLILKYARLKAL
jgi:DNA helicase-2/ATP-dependent DNA helicase PcrA